MRSSKSRSRSKSNRPRTMGNIINRVFDSSGPEGKVRGTPQQIIEKYLILARDAQLSNDRVAAENFLQHAEHYTRMLSEAQRELAAEQEARQQQYQNHNNQQGGGQNNGQPGGNPRHQDRSDRNDARDPGAGDQPEVPAEAMTLTADEESTLVETPEMKREGQPQAGQNQRREGDRSRRDFRGSRPQYDRRAPRGEGNEGAAEPAATPEAPAEPSAPVTAAPEAPATEAPAAEAPKPRKPAAPRKPRTPKPKTEAEKPEAAE
ncbi:MAG: hypothetical protein BGP11_13885 [Rhodobacterales bacterium 65-51]|uniref:DUF4167 domain-containing protein n=1 Tax=uncultured Gemmobacter sp. TaxID=1095917 RepID=UPI00095F4667|nr:DUF4167 domain-containing protein [uncultured Gemmobacter sp.]OJY27184.1 MAG: hypothetical protein BGP11_13885 [Rhodobacterales bacterium 65-51]